MHISDLITADQTGDNGRNKSLVIASACMMVAVDQMYLRLREGGSAALADVERSRERAHKNAQQSETSCRGIHEVPPCPCILFRKSDENVVLKEN